MKNATGNVQYGQAVSETEHEMVKCSPEMVGLNSVVERANVHR